MCPSPSVGGSGIYGVKHPKFTITPVPPIPYTQFSENKGFTSSIQYLYPLPMFGVERSPWNRSNPYLYSAFLRPHLTPTFSSPTGKPISSFNTKWKRVRRPAKHLYGPYAGLNAAFCRDSSSVTHTMDGPGLRRAPTDAVDTNPHFSKTRGPFQACITSFESIWKDLLNDV